MPDKAKTDGQTLNSVIGAPIRRAEDHALLTGEAAFVEDIQLPGALWLQIVRSPHAHASITNIDTESALADANVVAVITGRDVHPRYNTLPTVSMAAYGGESAPYDLIAVEKVRHVGEAVAMVVGRERYATADAANNLVVEYEAMKAVVDPEEALDANAPRVHDDRPNELHAWQRTSGDAAKALKEADVVIRQRFVNHRLAPVPLEPRAAIAHWDGKQQKLTVWATNQAAQSLKSHLLEVLGLPEDSVRVVVPHVGGGFGAKHEDPEYALVAIASIQTGLPVKWVATRSEDFGAMHYGRGKVSHVEIGCTRAGRVTAVRIRHIADLGAYAKGPEPSLAMSSAMLSVGVYRIENVELDVHTVYTHKTPAGPYRGAGRPEGIFAIERTMDLLARELGMDPAELRRLNYIPPDAFPYRTAAGDNFDSGNYEAALDRALELCDYTTLRKKQVRMREEGRYLGIGLSSWVKTGGGGPSQLNTWTNRYEYGRVRMDPKGNVTIYTGTSPHGQGGKTTLAQIAAQVLHIPMGTIKVVFGDTDVVPYGTGTFASRSLVVGGTAIYRAAHKVLAKMQRIAAHNLEVDSEDIVFANGAFRVKGSEEHEKSFDETVQAAYQALSRPSDVEYGLDETSIFQPPGLTYNSGTYVAVVEVNAETGEVDVQKLVCVDDQGVVVNPMIVEGQVHGGATQGLGQALYEQVIYDEAGQLISGSLMDYALPKAHHAPVFVTDRIETPSPMNPLGVKGMGEGPTTGMPPAVANAVLDALEPFGIRHIDMPLTPPRIWRAIRPQRLST